MSFVPHTERDIQEMLSAIGAKEIADLFDEIPKDLLAKPFTHIPHRISELQLNRHAAELSEKQPRMQCYLGAGAYEHHIPAACWQVTSRGEFLTAYTPYQAEASQGGLQLIFEFQTMITRLTGMDVANASLYDGASALAEALLMAIRIKGKQASRRVILPDTLNPAYIETAKTILQQQAITVDVLSQDEFHTAINDKALQNENNYSAFVIPYPNFYGSIEDVDALTDHVHAQGALVVAVVNPIALGLLKEPGSWGQTGADIVVGEGQPLGNYLNGGGPYFGFMTTRKEFVRQMPGRIVALTQDKEGKPCYTLTLQAREQHIRRSKATSNICTNQGLMVTAATIYMALLGETGLRKVAEQCIAHAQYLAKALTEESSCTLVNRSASFHEFVIKLPVKAKQFVNGMATHGILAGLPLSQYNENHENELLICVTETKTKADLDLYVAKAKEVMHAVEVDHAYL